MRKFLNDYGMPCDYSGFCAGTSCPIFFECQGAVKKSSKEKEAKKKEKKQIF